ncbi:MAG: DUF1015 domain-containing protein [Dehalococcoidia bacterium]|nr:MAG: DUF1015 domain-containing protein [Dehalococcoidia bacterium]
MAEVQPFRGVRYNQQLVKDLASVICPPYDIIPPQMEQELYLSSDYNFVRLEAARELPQDMGEDNKYTRAAATLKQWLEQGVLQVDGVPAIYLHHHHFTHSGKEYWRRGMLLRVRLEEWDRMVVRPHEGTLSKPKADRVSLLWALQANTSPIWALFQDEQKRVAQVLTEEEKKEPVINFAGHGGEKHVVWAVSDTAAINQIERSLARQPIYIADGHHRYESALTYRRERLTLAEASSEDEAFNFVLMMLVDFADPGLVILPPHRLIRGISRLTLDEMVTRLRLFFAVEELPLSAGVWQQVDRLLATEVDQPKVVLFGLSTEKLMVLKLRDFASASQMMPYFHSELYKRLDVSVVDHIILEKVLELSSEREEVTLSYSHTRQDAVDKVLSGEYQLAFLLSPVRVETIKAIADIGDRMPRKSTYFYPKAPAGLVFYRLG